MNFLRLSLVFTIATLLMMCDVAIAQMTATIGNGSSSSSTRGPFQRSDTASSTVFSRFVHVYTANELAGVGISNGAGITELRWELASDNVIIGNGDATLKVYIKNSTATEAAADTWDNQIAGSTLAVDNAYNTSNNFPGANGWMPFSFSAPFTYTGGAVEIAVDWDCSQVSTPAFSGNGAIKWRWQSTAPDFLVVKKTSSSAPSTTISDLKDERANIQIVYTTGSACAQPTALNADNITTTSADLTWASVMGAVAYNWKIVAAGAGSGGTAIDMGSTTDNFVSSSSLSPLTAYDLFVETDCGAGNTSGYAGPHSFLTKPEAVTIASIGAGTSSSSTRGPFQRSDTASSTVFSRFVHIYTAAELANAGLAAGTSLTELNWELASSNVVIGNGNANLKVYVKNSSATEATADSWSNLISGSTLVFDKEYNTTNNFPGMSGWMPFAFFTPFTYTGGAIEIAVDWDCSQVTTPAFSGDGSLKWRWESTAPDILVVKRTSSSSPSTTISDLKDERANIQLVSAVPVCFTAIDAVVSNVSCNEGDDGAIDLSVTDGVPGYTFSWSNSATTEDISGLTAGLYTVVITDADGCPYTDSILVTEPTALMTTTSTIPDVDGAGIGEASIIVSGGTPPYSYTWDGIQGSQDSIGLTTGTYMIEITDANGCVDNTSVFIGNTVDITDIDGLTDLSIMPNPTNGLANVQVELTRSTDVAMLIYNVNGQLLDSVRQKNTTQFNHLLDLSDYTGGMYFVQFIINEQTLTRKLMLY